MKTTNHHTYSLLALLMASPVTPMPEFMRTHQLTRMHGGLYAMLRSEEPKPDDWRVVVDAVNLMETLVVQGKIEDADGTLPAASKALAESARRSMQGNGIRLDAQGIAAVRGVLDDYRFVLENLPHREMMQCHRATETRIWDIQAGKTQAQDIVISI